MHQNDMNKNVSFIRKQIDVSVEEFKKSKIESGKIYCRVCKFDTPDSYGDIFDKSVATGVANAINNTGKPLPVLMNHKGILPVGYWSDAVIGIDGVYAIANLTLNDKYVKETIIPELENKSIMGCSMGFNVIESEVIENETDEQYDSIRFKFINIDVREISITPIPAHKDAEVLMIKSIDINTFDSVKSDVRTLEKMLTGKVNISKKTAKALASLIVKHQAQREVETDDAIRDVLNKNTKTAKSLEDTDSGRKLINILNKINGGK